MEAQFVDCIKCDEEFDIDPVCPKCSGWTSELPMEPGHFLVKGWEPCPIYTKLTEALLAFYKANPQHCEGASFLRIEVPEPANDGEGLLLGHEYRPSPNGSSYFGYCTEYVGADLCGQPRAAHYAKEEQ